MKILYLIHQFFPEFYTGTETIFLNVAGMAQSFGHKVKVLTHSYYEDGFYDRRQNGFMLKDFSYKGIPVLAIRPQQPSGTPYYVLEDRDQAKIARELIAREAPDLVHVAHPMHMPEFVKVLPELGIPYILTLTDFFLTCPKYTLIRGDNTLCRGPEGGRACPQHCPEFSERLVQRRLALAREMLFNAARVTCLSQFQAEVVREEFPELDCRVVNPGLRYRYLKQNERRYQQGDPVVFGFAGSLNFHKGVHTVIEAFAKAADPNISLQIYGSGPDAAYVEQLRTAAGTDPRIRFMGKYAAAEIGAVLQQVDVMIVPSLWYETYCLVMHEAFACNLPVIGCDVGMMAEKITPGETGFRYPIGQAVPLQAIIEQIAKDPPRLNSMKQHVRNMLIPNVEQEAYAYQRLYERIGNNPAHFIDPKRPSQHARKLA